MRLLHNRSLSSDGVALNCALLLALRLALGYRLCLDTLLLARLLALGHAARSLSDWSIGDRVHLASLLALLLTLGLALSLGDVLLNTGSLALLLALRHALDRSSCGGLVDGCARSLTLLLALRLAARRSLRSAALLLAGLLTSWLTLGRRHLDWGLFRKTKNKT